MHNSNEPLSRARVEVEAEKRDRALPSVLFWTTFNMLYSQCVTKYAPPREEIFFISPRVPQGERPEYSKGYK